MQNLVASQDFTLIISTKQPCNSVYLEKHMKCIKRAEIIV